jgi:hypothetical protein
VENEKKVAVFYRFPGDFAEKVKKPEKQASKRDKSEDGINSTILGIFPRRSVWILSY